MATQIKSLMSISGDGATSTPRIRLAIWAIARYTGWNLSLRALQTHIRDGDRHGIADSIQKICASPLTIEWKDGAGRVSEDGLLDFMLFLGKFSLEPTLFYDL
jgi:hypothetical protein